MIGNNLPSRCCKSTCWSTLRLPTAFNTQRYTFHINMWHYMAIRAAHFFAYITLHCTTLLYIASQSHHMTSWNCALRWFLYVHFWASRHIAFMSVIALHLSHISCVIDKHAYHFLVCDDTSSSEWHRGLLGYDAFACFCISLVKMPSHTSG